MSHIEIREAQILAAQMLESASHLPRCMFDERGPLETVACNLEVTALNYPPDYAKTVLAVIEVARHAFR